MKSIAVYLQHDMRNDISGDYYIYLYSDPRDGKAFYVGKGKGRRCYAHLNATGESAKVKKIQEILARGEKPRIEILARELNEEAAFLAEAVAIDAFGLRNLTNEVAGHRGGKYMRMDADLVDAYSQLHALSREDFTVPMIAITVNQLFDPSKTAEELYDITRAHWRVSLPRAEKCKYALAVYHGIVMEVYEIERWMPGSKVHLKTRSDTCTDQRRFAFDGHVAPDAIRVKFRGRNMRNLIKKGCRTPIHYF